MVAPDLSTGYSALAYRHAEYLGVGNRIYLIMTFS